MVHGTYHMKTVNFDQLALPTTLEICGFWLKTVVFIKTADFDQFAPPTTLEIQGFWPKTVVFMKTMDFDRIHGFHENHGFRQLSKSMVFSQKPQILTLKSVVFMKTMDFVS